jgi:hypothetical protein
VFVGFDTAVLAVLVLAALDPEPHPDRIATANIALAHMAVRPNGALWNERCVIGGRLIFGMSLPWVTIERSGIRIA